MLQNIKVFQFPLQMQSKKDQSNERAEQGLNNKTPKEVSMAYINSILIYA